MPHVQSMQLDPQLDAQIYSDITRVGKSHRAWQDYYEKRIRTRPGLQFNFGQILKSHLGDSDYVIFK